MQIQHRSAKIFGLFVFAAVCISIFLYLYTAAGGRIRLHEPYKAKAIVPTAFQLVYNADVRAAGVKIGTVSDIDSDGENGVVTFEMDEKHDDIFKDATVRVRTKTLVGENYLDLDPGSARAGKLPKNGTIPLAQAREAVQLDEILDMLDPRTQRKVRRNLDGLGDSLAGRGQDLNRTLGAIRPTVVAGGGLTDTLHAQRRAVARVVDNTGATMQAFADRTAQVRTLATQAKRTAEAVVDRDREFGAALEQIAPTLRQAQSSTTKLASFSQGATPVLRDLRLASRDLTPVMSALGPAARRTNAVLGELPSVLNRLDPLLDQLAPFSSALAPAVSSTDSVLRQLNPALGYLGGYSREIGSFFGNVGSAQNTKDATGNVARVLPMFSPSSYTGLSPEAKKAVDALTSVGGLAPLLKEEVNSFPEAGTVGNPSTKQNFQRVQP